MIRFGLQCCVVALLLCVFAGVVVLWTAGGE